VKIIFTVGSTHNPHAMTGTARATTEGMANGHGRDRLFLFLIAFLLRFQTGGDEVEH
jgi:hypothetical protein